MKITRLCLLFILIQVATPAKEPPKRPRILDIAGVTILVSNVADSRGFYRLAGDPSHSCDWCERIPTATSVLSSGQMIILRNLPSQPPTSLLEEVMFRTENVGQLMKFLKAQKVAFQEERNNLGQHLGISLRDPEGHRIFFVGMITAVANTRSASRTLAPGAISPRIIHVGFVVHDRATMEHFYKDILGFRLYWHGGMKDDETNWVDMQVPDGTDWIEFMLNVPANADHHTLGVMNHIALGVPDIKAAREQLIKNGWTGTEQPKIGRDGKWQLNLYDPDDTRVEFMEFTPTQKPCCSEYTGPHPGQKP
jgi:catechol 2,3-dioxygenase-like lactoylglutathione lyase family enzyme